MRLREFASAEEQMALWRLVSDNVWASIGQQVKQERRQRAEKATQAKVKAKHKPNAKRGKSIGAVPMPTSVPNSMPTATTKLPKPKLAHTTKPDSLTATSPKRLASSSGVSSNAQVLPTAAALNVKSAQPAVTAQEPATSAVVNASNDSKDVGIWRNTAVKNKFGDTADRHSENGLRANQQTLRKPIAR